jgi:hypothetical protein
VCQDRPACQLLAGRQHVWRVSTYENSLASLEKSFHLLANCLTRLQKEDESMIALRQSLVRCLLFASIPAGTAQADPITLTSGTVTVVVSGSVRGASDIAGSEFSFVGSNDGGSTRAFCEPCTSGERVGFATELLAPFHGIAASGGVDHTLTASGSFGAWRFEARDFVLPASTSIGMSFSAPFTFSGFFGEDGSSGEPFFRADLVGKGTATAHYRLFHGDPGAGPLYTFERLHFDFDSSAPVPEPASLTLLGGGLLVIARRRCQTRRRKETARPLPGS